jgi:hypothetical protein
MDGDAMKTITDNEEKKFKNALEATAFLQDQGWKVKKSSTYRHIQEGKLRPEVDGAFTEKTVLRYAKNFLNRLDGTPARRGDRAQQDRAEVEGRKLRAQSRLWEMKAAILEGNYVQRTEFEIALAQRAVLFRNDLTSFCYTFAPEIIHLVNGDVSKVSELIEAMKDKIDDVLCRYASKEGATPLPMPDSGTMSEIMENADFSEIGPDGEDE